MSLSSSDSVLNCHERISPSSRTTLPVVPWTSTRAGWPLAAVACVVLMGQGKAKKPGPVEATAFVLKDADGKNWDELGITDNGFCRLVLRDSQGHDMVWLSVNEEGTIAALRLRDKRGTNRVELVGAVEAAGLNLKDIRGDRKSVV